jgi:hypothetical protein
MKLISPLVSSLYSEVRIKIPMSEFITVNTNAMMLSIIPTVAIVLREKERRPLMAKTSPVIETGYPMIGSNQAIRPILPKMTPASA